LKILTSFIVLLLILAFCGQVMAEVGDRVEFVSVTENEGTYTIVIAGTEYDQIRLYPIPKINATARDVKGTVDGSNMKFVVKPGNLLERFTFHKENLWALVDRETRDTLKEEWPIGAMKVVYDNGSKPDEFSYYFRALSNPKDKPGKVVRIDDW